jgi:N-acyl-D-amino-acid deacylase
MAPSDHAIDRPDLVLVGGTIVDGSGAPPVRADLGIRGDRIVTIGPDLTAAESARRLDATGCVVTPGFIDIHSHSDFTLVVDPAAESAISQGVTTELVGNCGHGCVPLGDPDRHAGNIYGFDPSFPIAWRSFTGYLDAVDAARPAVNVAALVPHGTLRLTAMVDAERAATEREQARIGSLLDQALDEGAFGLSTGLEYATEGVAIADDIVPLCERVARRDALYATHTRNKDVRAVEAIREAVETARRAGVRLQVSHVVPRPGAPPNALQSSMDVIDEAAANGLEVAFDVHTRLFGFTNLSVALPRWVVDGGPDLIRDVLANRRDEVAGHRSIINSFGIAGYWGVYIVDAPLSPEVAGRSVAELAGDKGRGARNVIFDVLAAHADHVDQPMIVGWSYTVDQIAQAAAHPRCSPSSDATTLSPKGPLAHHVFHGAYSWAAWYLETIIEARHALPLEAAIHRLTGLPAAQIGLTDRGVLQVGAAADVAVFDPAAIHATATFEEPNRLATGMRHVLTNGVAAIENGRLTGERAGRALRR